MKDDKSVKENRNNPDNGIVGHKAGIYIECFPAIIDQELQIAAEMDDQEWDQEQPGEAHHILLPERRGKKSYDPVHGLKKKFSASIFPATKLPLDPV